MASSDLLWSILRNGHSFLVKRDGVTLSAEPGNLTNQHSFKFSGLANKRVVSVEASTATKKGKDGKEKTRRNLSLVLRKSARKPAFTAVSGLNSGVVKGQSRDAQNIRRLVKQYKRADLASYAVARYHACSCFGI